MKRFNLAKLLPAVTAIGALCVTSAFAFGSHPVAPGSGNPNGTSSLVPTVCFFLGSDDDASASFVTISPRNLALQLATFNDGGDDFAYGLVGNSATPTWASINFDVTENVDFDSVCGVVCSNPFGFVDFQDIFIPDMFLVGFPRQRPGQNIPFATVSATAAYLAQNRFTGGPFFAGAQFQYAYIGQGSDGNTILVQNVQVNGGHFATNQLVAAGNNCDALDP